MEKTAPDGVEQLIARLQQGLDAAYARIGGSRVDLREQAREVLEALDESVDAQQEEPRTSRAIAALRERARDLSRATAAKAAVLVTLGHVEPANDNARVIAAIRAAEIRQALAHLGTRDLEAAWTRADGETRRALVEAPLRPAWDRDGRLTFEPWIADAFVARQVLRAARLAHPELVFEIDALETLTASLLAIADAASRRASRHAAVEVLEAAPARVAEAVLA